MRLFIAVLLTFLLVFLVETFVDISIFGYGFFRIAPGILLYIYLFFDKRINTIIGKIFRNKDTGKEIWIVLMISFVVLLSGIGISETIHRVLLAKEHKTTKCVVVKCNTFKSKYCLCQYKVGNKIMEKRISIYNGHYPPKGEKIEIKYYPLIPTICSIDLKRVEVDNIDNGFRK